MIECPPPPSPVVGLVIECPVLYYNHNTSS